MLSLLFRGRIVELELIRGDSDRGFGVLDREGIMIDDVEVGMAEGAQEQPVSRDLLA